MSIEERKALRKLIEAKGDKVDGCIRALPAQMRVLERCPENAAVRRIVAANLERLRRVALQTA